MYNRICCLHVFSLSLSHILDLNIFSTKTLTKQCGDHDVEIREQVSDDVM